MMWLGGALGLAACPAPWRALRQGSLEGSLSEMLLLDRSMGANSVLVLLSKAPGLGSPSLWTLRALETHSGPDRIVFHIFCLVIFLYFLLSLTILHYEIALKIKLNAFLTPKIKSKISGFYGFRRCFAFWAVPRYHIIFF